MDGSHLLRPTQTARLREDSLNMQRGTDRDTQQERTVHSTRPVSSAKRGEENTVHQFTKKQTARPLSGRIYTLGFRRKSPPTEKPP